MVTVCKSERIKQLGKLSIVPGFFGINEPIIFGLPVVLNPVIAIPFILVPMMNLILSYFATLWGIIPRTTGVNLPWTTPIGFSGWLATGSWRASVWQIFLLVLGMMIYYPFIKTLDKKYLILEMLNKPNFYEGELFYQILYDINKSMIENVKEYNLSITDFKEYVEMWIHEVKIPIASLTLISHNHQNEIDKKYIEQIRKLDNYIDQILYFVRSENVEKDYIIKEKKLQEIIKNVALKNKDDLLENAVRLDVDVHNEKVLTDSKWLEFILNQIINNSIKYKRKNTESLSLIHI